VGIIKSFFGDSNSREIKKLEPSIFEINKFEEDFKDLSDSKIKEESKSLKEEVRKELEDRKDEWVKLPDDEQSKMRRRIEDDVLGKHLPRAFALVREAAKRTIDQRHFDVQLMGGIILHEGKIAQMRTGEGKTLVSTLPVYLNALTGRGVHVVTVNDYLARRDTGWMGQIYSFLGLSVGTVIQEMSYLYDPSFEDESALDENLIHLKQVDKKDAYLADITYGTNNEFGFDYLRDNMVGDLSQMAQRDLHYAIVDEVDSILIDEARTPLIISAPAEKSADLYYKFADLVKKLKKDKDYNVDEKAKASTLTEEGIANVEKMLGMGNIYEEGGIQLVHHLEQALKAQALFKLDKDYVVKDGEVIIVDEFTGRLMHGRRYSEGLHQAIEAKESVDIKRESRTMATITFQNYFRMYEKISGMTGTASTEAEEFSRIYKLEVTEVPTNRDNLRKDMPDVVYKTEDAKFNAVAEGIKEITKTGQPILVGTVSIEKNEKLSSLLRRNGVKHEVLNAKNHEQEAHIITQAGKLGGVTIATNMAGRGVDIILGGYPKNEEEQKKVKKLGGLYVIGTERHESRRIDNQLRGRSGRQGDPGTSRFFVSLEDDLMRVFGSDNIKGLMDRLGLPDDQAIENKMLSRALESAQKKVEGHNFDIRKHLLEYDDVINKHREAIYRRRKRVLKAESLKDEIIEMLSFEIANLVHAHVSVDTGIISEDGLREIKNGLRSILPQGYVLPDLSENPEKLIDDIAHLISEEYEKKEAESGEKNMRLLEKAVYLRIIDTWWIEHLEAIDSLKEGIGLRGYGQRDPLVEFKREAYSLYERLITGIEGDVSKTIFKVQLAKQEQPQNITPLTEGKKYHEEAGSGHVSSKSGKKVGRNDPCPCGSGKKYKKCCGK
jgi:preprotein translocase subunit SecA